MALPPSRRLDFSEVPVIDLGPLLKDGPIKAKSTVDQIAKACSEVGFMQVVNHGVPDSAIERVIAESAPFFALPVEKRNEIAISNSPQFRGYLPLKYKGEASTGEIHQEAFIMFHDKPESACPMDGPNQWPAGRPGFRKAFEDYFPMTEKLGMAMLPAFALAMGKAPDFFEEMFRDPMMMLKVNHYPPQEVIEHDKEIGVTAHSDSGAFTILWQDEVGGLEISNKKGEWVGVPPIKGAYVINLGNMMQIWSNGRFSSTPHRVINRSGLDRYSVPTFVNPNYYTMIEPLVGTPASDFVPYMSGDEQYDLYWRIYPQKNKRVREAVTA